MNKKHILNLAIFIAIIAAVMLLTFSNKKEFVAKVNRIEKVESTHGDKDGVYTDVYFLVMTDKGTFRINTNGLLSAPELCGTIKEDSSYTFKTVGVNCPSVGLYSSIISLK
jgi:hypothetical protein